MQTERSEPTDDSADQTPETTSPYVFVFLIGYILFLMSIVGAWIVWVSWIPK